MLVDTSSLINTSIREILTPLCEPVHPAWIDKHTTSIATSMAVLRLSDDKLVLLAPCEVQLETERYPSLGLSIKICGPSTLQWVRNGKIYSMIPLTQAAKLLPFRVHQAEQSDPLGEGTASEIVLVESSGSRLLFRHIMPPMTLGIELAESGQAPNNSFKPTPLRGAA